MCYNKIVIILTAKEEVYKKCTKEEVFTVHPVNKARERSDLSELTWWVAGPRPGPGSHHVEKGSDPELMTTEPHNLSGKGELEIRSS